MQHLFNIFISPALYRWAFLWKHVNDIFNVYLHKRTKDISMFSDSVTLVFKNLQHFPIVFKIKSRITMAFKAMGLTYLFILISYLSTHPSKLDFHSSDREETFASDVPSIWNIPHSPSYPLKTNLIILKPRTNTLSSKKIPLISHLVYCLCTVFL